MVRVLLRRQPHRVRSTHPPAGSLRCAQWGAPFALPPARFPSSKVGMGCKRVLPAEGGGRLGKGRIWGIRDGRV